MPAKGILCVICGTRGRYRRSQFTKICTIEREEKIREGYRRRLKKELNSSLFNEQIHLSCYKSLVYDIGPLSINSGAGRSRRRKCYSRQLPHSNSSLTVVTSDRSTFTITSYDLSTASNNTDVFPTTCSNENERPNYDCNDITDMNSSLNDHSKNLELTEEPCNVNLSVHTLSDDDACLSIGTVHQSIRNTELCTLSEQYLTPSSINSGIAKQINTEKEQLTPVYSEEPFQSIQLEEDQLSTVMDVNNNNDISMNNLVKHGNMRKLPSRPKRRRQTRMSSKRDIHGKSTRYEMRPPCPDTTEEINLYSNGFEELCA
ncbi:unnamed protein product [Adineta ricciae]|uniref:Uncharacterized protein n=1 Tax=Adineta ricciae TaxID=249248 RepID=A0A815SXP6_ADIRI|nr:unnamed protein product [Adineta ricciae]